MTVREFFDTFSEEEMDKELIFDIGLILKYPMRNLKHFTCESYNEMYRDEVNCDYFSENTVKNNNRVIVEL